MAGDWIKVEHATLDKPEVSLFSELLGVPVDQGLGILLRFWVWMDKNARNGTVTNVTPSVTDTVMHCAGFSEAMVAVGWIKFDEALRTMSIPNFERHNETPAKTRLSNAERQAKFRNAKRNKKVTLHPLPEKRRVLNPIVPLSSPLFVTFWDTWPANPRKSNKKGCAEIWGRDQLDAVADQIFAHVTVMKGTEQWVKFAPLPATYLNQRRWEDGKPADPNGPDAHAKKVAWALG